MRIRPSTRALRLMYSSSDMFGQKFVSWMTLFTEPITIDTAEALYYANRVPVNVVIDYAIAVLEVLAL